jgi:hypothetical protein
MFEGGGAARNVDAQGTLGIPEVDAAEANAPMLGT